MARHARIYASIWADEDFLAAPKSPQRLFLFLVSQPDIDNAGVLALRKGRWSYSAPDETPDAVEAALADLTERRFIVVDPRTEELLVRSFMRWDGVWRQPYIARNAAKCIRALTSPMLRAAVRAELLRITLDPAGMKAETFADLRKLRETLIDELGDDSAKASGNPLANPLETLSRGSAEPKGVITPSPSPSPSPVPPSAGANKSRHDTLPGTEVEPASPTITQRSKAITDAYANAEPMCKWPAVNGIVMRAIKSERYADDEIQAALLRLASEGRGVTVETLRTELDGLPPPRYATSRRPTTDERVAAIQALKTPQPGDDDPGHTPPNAIPGEVL